MVWLAVGEGWKQDTEGDGEWWQVIEERNEQRLEKGSLGSWGAPSSLKLRSFPRGVRSSLSWRVTLAFLLFRCHCRDQVFRGGCATLPEKKPSRCLVNAIQGLRFLKKRLSRYLRCQTMRNWFVVAMGEKHQTSPRDSPIPQLDLVTYWLYLYVGTMDCKRITEGFGKILLS